ncbi:MAG TPA: MscL family protein [Gemmatimonadota bacterium]|jgi:large conductance mechanosensitive channel
MLKGFREFLTKENFVALALAVVLGTATAKVVSAIVEGAVMPVVGLVLPAGNWRETRVVLDQTVRDGEVVENAIQVGSVLGALLDFLIIAFVVYLVGRALVKAPPPPDTRTCPFCRETIPAEATRCKFCTADLRSEQARAAPSRTS